MTRGIRSGKVPWPGGRRRAAVVGAVLAATAAVPPFVPGLAASAGAQPPQTGSCYAHRGPATYDSVTVPRGTGMTYYLGAPNSISASGKTAAELKPAKNSTTLWVHCVGAGGRFEFTQQRGTTIYALTTRDFQPGGDVLLQVSHTYPSQEWFPAGTNPHTFKNLKTGLYLRIRNSGPGMYQTITTGLTPTAWDQATQRSR